MSEEKKDVGVEVIDLLLDAELSPNETVDILVTLLGSYIQSICEMSDNVESEVVDVVYEQLKKIVEIEVPSDA